MKWREHNTLETGTTVGFEWMIKHNNLGFRCGYVRIPDWHIWYGKEDIDCNVHGGLTYGLFNDGEFWIGFDCAHCGDAQDPDLPATYRSEHFFTDGEVRTQEYVRGECMSLCIQAAAAPFKL